MSDMIQMAEIKLTEKEIDAAVEVLRSGALRQGKVSAEFEEHFASKVGAGHALTCSSGSAALHLAYMACLKPGDEVLVPSFTFIATASMASIMGVRPVFCDIDSKTWTIDLKDARQKITEKTRAIVPVHIFGNACPVEEIRQLANEKGLLVIWDAAQAHGAMYDGQGVGGIEDMACYSFYPSKNMFTGEGGMVTLNDSELAQKIGYLRSHGQTGKYYHTMPGLNYRMTDVEAAIGLEQLNRLDDMLAIRRKNGKMLNEGLADVPGITPQKVTENSRHAYHQYCILVEKKEFGMTRDDLAVKLKSHEIATGVHYPIGLHRQPVFQEAYGYRKLQTCNKVCEQILALPVHHGLSDSEIGYMIETVSAIHRDQ